MSDALGVPEAFVGPQLLSAVDRGKDRGNGAHAAAGDEVDLHAGFMQRAQHARVIRASRAGTGEDDCRAKLWRVRLGVGHSPASWMVWSLMISNSREPPGVVTLTLSPGSLFRNARPIGEVVEIRPFTASASSGMTS